MEESSRMRAPTLTFNQTKSNHSNARFGTSNFESTSSTPTSTSTSTTTVKEIQTPNVISYSRRGALPHLTRDNVSKLPIELIHLSLDNLLDLRPPSYSYAPSLHHFLGLQQTSTQSQPILILSLLDPTIPTSNTSDDENKVLPITDQYASCSTLRGYVKTTPKLYTDWTLIKPPDILIALSDNTTSNEVGLKRRGKILTRSLTFLGEILKENKGTTNVFAPLVGSNLNLDSRREYSEALVGNGNSIILQSFKPSPGEPTLDFNVSGYLLVVPSPPSSSSSLNSNPLPTTSSLFLSSLSPLPENKPRMVQGVRGPHEILNLIKLVGIDLFVDCWSSELSSLGVGLDFDFPVPSSTDSNSDEGEGKGKKKSIGLNLFNIQHSTSFIPLSTSSLFSLSPETEHPFGPIPPTRAYVHHLLHQHELTSHVILAINNSIIMSHFFKSIRNLLAQGEGKFEREVERFFDYYEYEEGVDYECLREARLDWEKVEGIRGKGAGGSRTIEGRGE